MSRCVKIPTLDLHEIVHEDVDGLCHEFINSHWGVDKEVHIVTGHSPRMMNLVRNVLKLYDVEVAVGDPRNCGYIRVLM